MFQISVPCQLYSVCVLCGIDPPSFTQTKLGNASHKAGLNLASDNFNKLSKERCDLEIMDRHPIQYWSKLDEEVTSLGLNFERGQKPSSHSADFRKDVELLTSFVIKESKKGDLHLYYAIIVFLKYHPFGQSRCFSTCAN